LLHTGYGYCYTRPRLVEELGIINPQRSVLFTARPEIHEGSPLIRTPLVAAQQYQVMNLELAWASGPVTIQSEATYLELDRADGRTSDLWGAYVHGSWFLTGERRPYDRDFGVFRRVLPYENFWLVPTPRGAEAGLGAWEVAARWSHLSFVDFGDQYLHDLTVGINWYWNAHSRVMLNWIHPFAHNSTVGQLVDSQGDIIAARMQVDF
jgi:phosphate-selective porin OprO/OprP